MRLRLGGRTEAADALEAIAKGNDRYLMLGEGSPFFDIVLPCSGGITITIHVLRDDGALQSVLDDLEKRRRSGLAYDPGSQKLIVRRNSVPTGWHSNYFNTNYRPKTRVLLSERSVEIEVACSLASAAGFEVFRHEPGQKLPDRIIDQ